VSTRPPLPPVTRLEPAVVPQPEVSTLPGWVAALIYLGCLVVLGYAIWNRML
jgi:hypothetical protein